MTTETAFDRLTKGISPERRESALRVMLNAGLDPNDPAVVIAALLGHVGDATDQIDAATAKLKGEVETVLAGVREVAERQIQATAGETQTRLTEAVIAATREAVDASATAKARTAIVRTGAAIGLLAFVAVAFVFTAGFSLGFLTATGHPYFGVAGGLVDLGVAITDSWGAGLAGIVTLALLGLGLRAISRLVWRMADRHFEGRAASDRPTGSY